MLPPDFSNERVWYKQQTFGHYFATIPCESDVFDNLNNFLTNFKFMVQKILESLNAYPTSDSLVRILCWWSD